MKFLFALLFLAVSATVLAQKNNIIYLYKNDGRQVDVADSADFARVISDPDSGSTLYNVTELYRSGKRKLVGKSINVAANLYFDGSVISYFENGKRRAINNYNNGILIGDQYEYFPNGKLYTVKQNPGYGPLNDSLHITVNADSLGNPLVTNGNGYYKGYDLNFNEIVEEGRVENGRREGEWKFKDDSIYTRVQLYSSGKYISGKSIIKTGETKTYAQREVIPSFPGGVEAFVRYLSKNIRYPYYEKSNNIQGKVIVQFVVGKDGKVSDIKIIRSPTDALAKEALRVVANSPNWIPGMQFGIPIRALYTVPISFTLSEEIISRPLFH